MTRTASPALEVLLAANRRATPWKNGGGVTREIAVQPPGAGLDDFQWRVSLATVSAGGPFSAFPGVDRILTVIEGELTLDLATGESVKLAPDTAPYAFQGEAAVTAHAPPAPVTDLNVMVRRGAFAALVENVGPGEPAFLAPHTTAFLVAVTAGEVSQNGVSLALRPHDALRVEAGPTGAISPFARSGRLIRITLAANQGAAPPLA